MAQSTQSDAKICWKWCLCPTLGTYLIRIVLRQRYWQRRILLTSNLLQSLRIFKPPIFYPVPYIPVHKRTLTPVLITSDAIIPVERIQIKNRILAVLFLFEKALFVEISKDKYLQASSSHQVETKIPLGQRVSRRKFSKGFPFAKNHASPNVKDCRKVCG